jgi:hypothetical protein
MKHTRDSLSLLKSYIREAIDLGKVQFAHDRLDLPASQRTEKDTPEESELFDNIVGWVMGQEPPHPSQLAKIKTLTRDRSSPYNKFFSSYDSGPAYRGLYAIKEELLQRWIGRPLRREEKKDSNDWHKAESNEFIRPTGMGGLMEDKLKNVQSFSKNKEAAKKFCSDFSPKSVGLYCVIVTAAAEDNPGKFLDLESGIYKLKSVQRMVDEAEVLALGPIIMKEIEWIYIE